MPAGVRITPWLYDAVRQTHALLDACYRIGGGSVDPFDDWLDWFTSDAEFDPESCFLAWSGQELVGVALCWSSAFVKDLCVAAHFRRRGLGFALLGLAMLHFRQAGAPRLELRSHVDNPSGANSLYRKMGFISVET